MKKCRDCEHWFTTPQMQSWQGNCKKHPFEKDKYSEDANKPECPDFVDKYAKYQVGGVK